VEEIRVAKKIEGREIGFEEIRELQVDRISLERGRLKVRIKGEETVVQVRGIKDGELVEIEGEVFKISQRPERMARVRLTDSLTSFKLGFALGNLHQRVMLVGDEVFVSVENGSVLDSLREFNPEVVTGKFVPNVEIPVQVRMIDFAG